MICVCVCVCVCVLFNKEGEILPKELAIEALITFTTLSTN